MSEVLIFASNNAQYNDRLFIELQVQYMKIPSSEQGDNMLCTEIVFDIRNNLCTQHVLPRFELGIFMYWTCNSMNNLSLYCALVDAKIRASDKDLPVLGLTLLIPSWLVWAEIECPCKCRFVSVTLFFCLDQTWGFQNDPWTSLN